MIDAAYYLRFFVVMNPQYPHKQTHFNFVTTSTRFVILLCCHGQPHIQRRGKNVLRYCKGKKVKKFTVLSSKEFKLPPQDVAQRQRE